MSKLRLDYQKDTLFPWIGASLVVIVSIVFILVVSYFIHAHKQADELEAKLEAAYSAVLKEHAHKSSKLASAIGKVNLSQEIINANDVLRRLSVPWDELFKAVETSSGSHITLLTLEPDFDNKQVKISGEANTYPTIMKYITELQSQEVFGSVFLQNHDIKQDDPDKPVRFTLVANLQGKL
jgi:hypothetical protein